MSNVSRSPGAAGRRLLGACVVAAFVTVPLACGDSEEQSMCPVFEDYLEARATIQAVDPTSATAAGATEAVEEYLGAVQRLRETTDGRFAEAVDSLETVVADALRTLESVDDDAEYETWAPLVEDSFEDASDAAERVEELISPQCNPDTDD
jgi:hypothetical protein